MGNKCQCGNSSDRRIDTDSKKTFIECCGKCSDSIKDGLERISEDEKFRQGKSRENYEGSVKAVMLSLFILIVIGFMLIISHIWNYQIK